MNKKVLLVLSVCIVVVIASFFLKKEEKYYKYYERNSVKKDFEIPFTEDVLEEALAKTNLNWEIADIVFLKEGYLAYALKNNEGKVVSSLTSSNLKGNTLMASPMIFNDDSFERMTKEEVKEFIKLTFYLDEYATEEDFEKVYNDFSLYLNEKEKYESNIEGDFHNGIWNCKIGNEYIVINVHLVKSENSYYIPSIQFFDSVSYEEYLKISSKAKNTKYIQGEPTTLEDVTIADIKLNNIQINQNENLVYLPIVGYIKNIESISKEDNIMFNNQHIYYDDFVKATLVDETDTIEVIMKKSALTSKELKEIRRHSIYYNIQDKTLFLYISSKID